MSDETVFTAARRLVRFLEIDLQKGGLIKEETEQALHTLRIQVEKETARQKKEQK